MTFHPRDLFRVWADLVEISAVRSGEQVSRLEKMNVRIDVARQNELPSAIDQLSLRDQLAASRGNTLDRVPVNYDRRVADSFTISRINGGSTNEDQLVGVCA
jgi:hypothetical protein